MRCPRCDGDMGCQIMSMFNTDIICCDCKDIERKHPKYAEAVQADVAAIMRGEMNFAGIGLPEDLKQERVQ